MIESKDPPRGGSAPTRRILRKQANFGCAICGEPYLTYHHFDPPWAERHHDEPEGMIALCVKHAGMADAKAFTKEQLRAYKRSPANKGTTLESTFEWFRQNFLFIVGGNIAFKCNTIVGSSRERIIWLEEDEETAKNANFKITFRSVGVGELEGFLSKLLIPPDSPYAEESRDLIAWVSSDMVNEFDQEVPLCTVTGIFYLPQKVILRANETVYGGGTMGCNYIGTTNTAYHFG